MRVLVAPLNWGMGHATRTAVIINQLLQRGDEPILAADGAAYHFYKKAFPRLPLIQFKGITVRYGNRSQVGAMILQAPSFLLHILIEHHELKRIIRQFDIDMVISDNRFGLWSKKVKSIYITHQLNILAPRSLRFLEPLLWRVHRWFINRYDECWVPDYDTYERSLAKDLAYKRALPQNAKFIGPLSRLGSSEKTWEEIAIQGLKKHYPRLVLISGPEPHREYMFNEYASQPSAQSTLIICGEPHKPFTISAKANIDIVPDLPDELIEHYITTAQTIICRSGYSTIMDLDKLHCLEKAIFIPTPGQTEQEYLATIYNKK